MSKIWSCSTWRTQKTSIIKWAPRGVFDLLYVYIFFSDRCRPALICKRFISHFTSVDQYLRKPGLKDFIIFFPTRILITTAFWVASASALLRWRHRKSHSWRILKSRHADSKASFFPPVVPSRWTLKWKSPGLMSTEEEAPVPSLGCKISLVKE